MVIFASDELGVGVPLNVDDAEVSKMAVPGLGVQVVYLKPGNHKLELEDPVSRTTSNDLGL